MCFTAETLSNGVVERDFIVGEVVGVLWSPVCGSDHAPVVLMGHGGGLHKKTPALMARAHDTVTTWVSPWSPSMCLDTATARAQHLLVSW